MGLPENNESDIEISVNSFQELLCSFGSLNWSKNAIEMLQLSHIRCDRGNVITFLVIRVFLMCCLLMCSL